MAAYDEPQLKVAERGAEQAHEPSPSGLKQELRSMTYDQQVNALTPVQLEGTTSASPAQVHAAAAHGTSGGGSSLPHLAAIQKAFGHHDVSSVQAHVGGRASEATEAMGASAYASGNQVAFGGSPSLHTAAHEAAHVVQQRAGVSLAGGVGQSGDRYEQAADQVADAVVGGKSAESLLDQQTGGASSGAVQQSTAVQCYAQTEIDGDTWRVADDGKFAVRQDDPTYGGRHFYATSGMISSSNSALQGQKSMLALDSGGDSQKVGAQTLTRVEPTNLKTNTSGNDRAGGMMWPQDCGVAANSVMHQDKYKGKGVYNKEREATFIEQALAYIQGVEAKPVDEQETPARNYGTVYYKHRGRKQYSPQQILNDIFEDVSGKEFQGAWDSYKALSEADRDAFDKLVGLNKYAQAEVGEAYSIVANRDENIDQRVWNFHWGGVVMRGGGDSVTMENFAGSGEDAWDFQMYGPPSKKGQTFHEQQKARFKKDGTTPEYGDNPTTVRVRPTDG